MASSSIAYDADALVVRLGLEIEAISSALSRSKELRWSRGVEGSFQRVSRHLRMLHVLSSKNRVQLRDAERAKRIRQALDFVRHQLQAFTAPAGNVGFFRRILSSGAPLPSTRALDSAIGLIDACAAELEQQGAGAGAGGGGGGPAALSRASSGTFSSSGTSSLGILEQQQQQPRPFRPPVPRASRRLSSRVSSEFSRGEAGAGQQEGQQAAGAAGESVLVREQRAGYRLQVLGAASAGPSGAGASPYAPPAPAPLHPQLAESFVRARPKASSDPNVVSIVLS
eukprot:tig00020614_g12142.t1